MNTFIPRSFFISAFPDMPENMMRRLNTYQQNSLITGTDVCGYFH
jgi:hypothetical protein